MQFRDSPLRVQPFRSISVPRTAEIGGQPTASATNSSRRRAVSADLRTRDQASCVDDPVEARAIWYVAPRSGAVMCPAYVARPEDRWS